MKLLHTSVWLRYGKPSYLLLESDLIHHKLPCKTKTWQGSKLWGHCYKISMQNMQHHLRSYRRWQLNVILDLYWIETFVNVLIWYKIQFMVLSAYWTTVTIQITFDIDILFHYHLHNQIMLLIHIVPGKSCFAASSCSRLAFSLPSVINYCSFGNHSCDHECVSVLSRYHCRCYGGYNPLEDGNTCQRKSFTRTHHTHITPTSHTVARTEIRFFFFTKTFQWSAWEEMSFIKSFQIQPTQRLS